jgi:DNA-binding response OmpR family regulator
MEKTALQRILAVEDEQDIAHILDLSLRQVGKFDVQLYSNGQDAIAHADQFQPQLLLLDFMLPGMDGLTLMGELRAVAGLEDVPVIFLTAKSQPSEVESYLAAGAVAVINKPFDPMHLPDQIRETWNNLPA